MKINITFLYVLVMFSMVSKMCSVQKVLGWVQAQGAIAMKLDHAQIWYTE